MTTCLFGPNPQCQSPHQTCFPWIFNYCSTRLATSPDFLRLTPPIPLSNGAIFSTSSVKSKEWIVEVAVRVHGATRQGGSKGGRGFGFWYTKVSIYRHSVLAIGHLSEQSFPVMISLVRLQKVNSQQGKRTTITTAKSPSSARISILTV